MSSLPNQPDAEEIVFAFKSTQNQSWSKFNNKLGCIPVKDCKKKDIFKSENPIELSDEDISVFGLVPRLEKLVLVSCDKCSMIVKSDCIHDHYNHRHNNPENDLFSVAQFIIPNVKTNKHKRPKLNVRKLPEKKIIDGVNIDPIVQGIKSEFDQVEFERLSELNRASKQQGNIQYDGKSTSVNLALHCTPGTSYYNELCTQSLVQYPDQNEVNEQMIDFDEDLTKSVNIIKELQNNKCIDDTNESINEDIVQCITKVELNEKRKRRIEFIDCNNDDEEFYGSKHPKKKYHLFPFKQNTREHSSLKTSNSYSGAIRNQNSENVFTCYDQEVNDKIKECDKNVYKLFGNGKELITNDNKDKNIINYGTFSARIHDFNNMDFKSFDFYKNRSLQVKCLDILNNESKKNSLSTKPHVKNTTGNKCSDLLKNQNVDNFITCDHLRNFNKTDCDKNKNELFDDETKLKSNQDLKNIFHKKIIYHETNSEVSLGQQLGSNIKIKCTTDYSDCINDDNICNENNQDSINKYNLLIKPHTNVTSNNCSSVTINTSFDNVASLDAKVNDKITECNKDLSKLLDDEEKLQSNKCVNENIVNYFTVFNEPLDKLSLNLDKIRKHTKKSKDFMDKNNKHFYENKPYSKSKYSYLPLEPSNFPSTIEYEEDEYKVDETNANSEVIFFPLPPKSNNNEKLKTFIPISKFIKDMNSQCSSDSVSSFYKPSIVEHEKVEDQMDKLNATIENINLSITSTSLDGEKLKNYIPINKYVKAMDGPCSSDSLTNFYKPSTVKHEENKIDKIDDSKIAHLPLAFRSLNDNEPKKCNPINEDVNAMDDHCSRDDSIPSLQKPQTGNDEEIKNKMVKINTNTQTLYFPSLSPKLIDDKKLKKCVPNEELVKAMEVQCSSNSEDDFHESSSIKHKDIDEIDKINVDSNIIYLPLHLKSLNDEKQNKYFSINEFVKAIDNQYTSDSVTSIHKSLSIKQEKIEDKMDKINMNSKNLCLSLPSRSFNDHKPYIPISEFIKTMDDECFSDSGHSSHKSSTAEHKNIEDKICKTNVNSNIIYFPLPPKLFNEEKQNKCIPISSNVQYIDEQYSIDSSFHKSSIEHESVKDEMDTTNENSKILYFPLPPRSSNDHKLRKYVSIRKSIKSMDNQCTNDSAASFHQPSSVEHETFKDQTDKININSKILYSPLLSRSLNDKKPKKYVLIKKSVKAMDNQCSNDSVTINKLLTPSQNFKENIKISSNYMYPNNVSDGDENDKSKIQFYQLPSILMNNDMKMKYSPIYSHSILNDKNFEKIILSKDHSTMLSSNNESETEFAQDMYIVPKNNKNPDGADICYYDSSNTLQGFKNISKSSQVNNFVKEEYCSENSFNAYYQGLNDYTLSQVLKPLSSAPKHLDYDIKTSSGKEPGSENHNILKNNYCSSKFQSNEKEIEPKSIDALSDILNNKYFDDAFFYPSSTSSFVNKELRSSPLINDSNVMIDNTLKKYYQLLNNHSKAKLTANKHVDGMCNNNSVTSTSSYDRLSVSSLDIKERTKLSFTDIMSDENSKNVSKLQDNLMKNNKQAQTDGSFNYIINYQKFIDPIIKVDNSIAESHSTNNDKTKCSQTDLLFGRMGINNTSKDLIDNYTPINSNDEIVENLMNSYTSDISSNHADFAADDFTSVSSNAKSINNTTAPTSIEEYELTNDNNRDLYISNSSHYLHHFQHTLWNPESDNDHSLNYLTHHPVSDSNVRLESYDKTCYSYTDRAIQNENYLNHNINESTSDVDKYFQNYKDRLKKTTDEKPIYSKSWKRTSFDHIEAKMRKKRRLEPKVVDNKENYGVWDLAGYGTTYDFVTRPGLHQNHFSDESD